MKNEELTDECPFPSGKYKNEKMEDVPSEYLMNYYNKEKNPNGKVIAYIEDNLDVMKLDLGDKFEIDISGKI